VFELSPAVGTWKESVLYAFVGGSEGAHPDNGLIMDKAGNLYGVTAEGGAGNVGTVFELSPSDGSWSQQVIYNDDIHGVGNDGAGLIMDANGNIISASASHLFKLSPDGKGAWTPTILHTFSGFKAGDFSYPATPVLDSAGNLYGSALPYSKNGSNTGIVYKISSENGPYKNLINFNGKEGSNPSSGLMLDGAGNIYGVTVFGGKYGDGTVFKLSPDEKGGYTEKVLWNFNGTDGSQPRGGLIMNSAGNFYGTIRNARQWRFDSGSLEVCRFSKTALDPAFKPIFSAL
jgi:uncharacterized repeat protein (TIGR03803 family)